MQGLRSMRQLNFNSLELRWWWFRQRGLVCAGYLVGWLTAKHIIHFEVFSENALTSFRRMFINAFAHSVCILSSQSSSEPYNRRISTLNFSKRDAFNFESLSNKWSRPIERNRVGKFLLPHLGLIRKFSVAVLHLQWSGRGVRRLLRVLACSARDSKWSIIENKGSQISLEMVFNPPMQILILTYRLFLYFVASSE